LQTDLVHATAAELVVMGEEPLVHAHSAAGSVSGRSHVGMYALVALRQRADQLPDALRCRWLRPAEHTADSQDFWP
jgi:hypothetical protein